NRQGRAALDACQSRRCLGDSPLRFCAYSRAIPAGADRGRTIDPRYLASSMHSRPVVTLAAALTCLLSLPVYASCVSAFCSINTDWGASTTGLAEGNTLDFRYENIRQDQPRAGSRKVGVGEIPHHHDEVRTFNNNLVAT